MVSDKPGGDKSAGVSINFCSEDPAMYVEYNFFISFFGAATTVVAFRIVQRIKANKKFRHPFKQPSGKLLPARIRHPRTRLSASMFCR